MDDKRFEAMLFYGILGLYVLLLLFHREMNGNAVLGIALSLIGSGIFLTIKKERREKANGFVRNSETKMKMALSLIASLFVISVFIQIFL